jgi:hypothetical protein
MGTTLGSVLVCGTPTRQRSLRDFVGGLSRGRIWRTRVRSHRDLKPSNIMLGDCCQVFMCSTGRVGASRRRDLDP